MKDDILNLLIIDWPLQLIFNPFSLCLFEDLVSKWNSGVWSFILLIVFRSCSSIVAVFISMIDDKYSEKSVSQCMKRPFLRYVTQSEITRKNLFVNFSRVTRSSPDNTCPPFVPYHASRNSLSYNLMNGFVVANTYVTVFHIFNVRLTI